MKTLQVATICLLTAASTALSQQPNKAPVTIAAHQSTPEVRQKTFQKVWETVRDKFFDPTFGGVDWQQARARYQPRVTQLKSDQELYDLLEQMLAELHVSHFEIVPPETLNKLKQKPLIIGMSLKDVEGRVVIWRIWPNSSVSESPLRTGFVISRIDDKPVVKKEDAWKLMAGDPNTKLKVVYLDDKDELREVILERRGYQPNELEKENLGGGASMYSTFTSKRVADGIGYLSFSAFIKGLEKKVIAAIESMHDAPGIIIDLRGNGGGDDSVGIAMANMLFAKETQLMITRTRKGDDFYYKAKPRRNAYLGPVVILLDGDSGSASEQFAAGLQENGRAIVVGIKSTGEDMDAGAIELPTGALFIFPYGEPRTPKGVVVDGRGVIPNIEVSLTRKGLLQGNDEQLSAAIEFIKQKSIGNP